MYLLVAHTGNCANCSSAHKVGFKPLSYDSVNTYICTKCHYAMTKSPVGKLARLFSVEQIEFISDLSKHVYLGVDFKNVEEMNNVIERKTVVEPISGDCQFRLSMRSNTPKARDGRDMTFDKHLYPDIMEIVRYHASYMLALRFIEGSNKMKKGYMLLLVLSANQCERCGEDKSSNKFGNYYADLTVKGLNSFIMCRRCAVDGGYTPTKIILKGQALLVLDMVVKDFMLSGVIGKLSSLSSSSIHTLKSAYDGMANNFIISLGELTNEEKQLVRMTIELMFRYILIRGIAVVERELRYLYPRVGVSG